MQALWCGAKRCQSARTCALGGVPQWKHSLRFTASTVICNDRRVGMESRAKRLAGTSRSQEAGQHPGEGAAGPRRGLRAACRPSSMCTAARPVAADSQE